MVAALNDARAQFFLGATFMAITIFADDRAHFIEQYRAAKAEGDESVEQARAELIRLGDTDGLAKLEAFVGGGDDLDEGIDAFSDYLLAADSATLAQMAQGYQLQQWPKAEVLVAELEQLASDQQAKLAAERAAADDAADSILGLLVIFSVFAFLTGGMALIALSRSVVRPLASLKESVRAIISGNLETKATVSGPLEVASLAQDFNEMISARKRTEEALRKARDELEVRVQERTAALMEANEQLDRLARTDALTGIANHRALLDRLNREVEFSIKFGRPLTVLMLDMDGFKLFNDTYGHALGDEVLKTVARVLQQIASGSGIPGRYGGDEFLLILPGIDKAAARDFADRLVAAIGQIGFEAGHGSKVPISLSIGAASLPEDTESKDRLLALADAAMYEAKRWGEDSRESPRVVMLGTAGSTGALGALDGLLEAIHYRDHYTKTHSEVVAQYAAELALQAGLSEPVARALRIAGALHDVGKLMIPDDILKKPGPLTDEEYDVIKRHPLVGEMLIRETPFLEDVIQAVGCHHERYDGTGYPRGLEGEDIPLLGRVLAIADAYSAMCLDRPYRKALSLDEIIAELRAGAGTVHDARLVDIFVDMIQAERQDRAA